MIWRSSRACIEFKWLVSFNECHNNLANASKLLAVYRLIECNIWKQIIIKGKTSIFRSLEVNSSCENAWILKNDTNIAVMCLSKLSRI